MSRKRQKQKSGIGSLIVAAGVGAALGPVIIPKIEPYMLAWKSRIQFGRSDRKRDEGLRTPSDITRVDDLKYGEHRLQTMDIYYPKGTEGMLPTIVSIHGGGYVYGDKNVYQYYCMNLAQRGFTVVNFSYRVAPESRYPAQIEDTNAVMRYICAQAERYHIDKENIFFVGDSAGGHLNAQYSAAVTNPEYAALIGLDIPKFTLRATALNCGVYDMNELGKDLMVCYAGKDYQQYKEQQDILGHITADFPPSFVMSSTGDFLLKCAQPMADLLTERGVEAEMHIYGDEETKPGHVFHCDIRSEYAKKCNDEECEFFRRHIENT